MRLGDIFTFVIGIVFFGLSLAVLVMHYSGVPLEYSWFSWVGNAWPFAWSFGLFGLTFIWIAARKLGQRTKQSDGS